MPPKPASAANASLFLQVVVSKARIQATPAHAFASSHFRYNTRTYRESKGAVAKLSY